MTTAGCILGAIGLIGILIIIASATRFNRYYTNRGRYVINAPHTTPNDLASIIEQRRHGFWLTDQQYRINIHLHKEDRGSELHSIADYIEKYNHQCGVHATITKSPDFNDNSSTGVTLSDFNEYLNWYAAHPDE